MSLRHLALAALLEHAVDDKLERTRLLAKQARLERFTCSATQAIAEPLGLPGRPIRPVLRPHALVPQPALGSPRGLGALIHAVCHIEFNAINLALDAAWRFAGLPEAYYRDWIRVAVQEARHFQLLRALLRQEGMDYGDCPAHDGLWDMVERTKADVVARMALVPRFLEARGLDATPPMQAKLTKLGTPLALQAVRVLDVILRDEIGHVKVGNRWYRFVCQQAGLEPVAHFRWLCDQYGAPRLRPPLNVQARKMAGFSELELDNLSPDNNALTSALMRQL